MLNVLNYIYGYYKIVIDANDADEALDMILKINIITWGGTKRKDNAFEIYILAKDMLYFKAASSHYNIHYEIMSKHGLPFFLLKYKRRVGIVLGTLVFIIILHISSSVIWRVEVLGNEKIPLEKIVSIVDEAGCGIGSKISDIDVKAVANKVLIKSKDISWISINIVGNIAYVEVLELISANEDDPDTISNLVAGYDAEITEINLRHGHLYVDEGDSVKEGDILIGGIYDSANKILQKHAEGVVIGKVTENFTVLGNQKCTVKEYTRSKISNFSVVFFGKKINIYSFSGNVGVFCDKIIREDDLSIFGFINLPIVFYREELLYYVNKDIILSETDQIALAMSRLNREIDLKLADAELLSKSINGYFTDDGYVAECSLVVLRDIGKSINVGKENDNED